MAHGHRPLSVRVQFQLYQNDHLISDAVNGAAAEVTLPSNLAAGNYLIRHEIIALHNAQAEGGAEFYASCTQLKVGGSGTGTPSSNDLVQLPGAYSDTDPGILIDVRVIPSHKDANLTNSSLGLQRQPE